MVTVDRGTPGPGEDGSAGGQPRSQAARNTERSRSFLHARAQSAAVPKILGNARRFSRTISG